MVSKSVVSVPSVNPVRCVFFPRAIIYCVTETTSRLITPV